MYYYCRYSFTSIITSGVCMIAVNDFNNRAECSGIVRNDEPTMPSRCTNVERDEGMRKNRKPRLWCQNISLAALAL